MVNKIEIDIPNVYTAYYNDTKPYQIWKGSRFSAKSWTKALFFLLKCRGGEYFRLVYARDTQKNVRQSQYQSFIDISKKFGLYNEYEFRSSDMKITHKGSGYFMTGGSFEQPDTLRSVADVTDFWAEEPITRTFAIDRESFLDIAGSLRNSYGVVPKFHFTFNPIGKDNFVYEDFFSENKVYPNEMVTVLHTDYTHNPFCPQDRIDFLNQLKKSDYKRWLVDGAGEWGEVRIGGEFWKDFKINVHAKDVVWNEQLPIHIAWDENVNPYLTCLVWQIEGKKLTQIDEICLEHPNNRVIDVCKEFRKRYQLERVKGLFVYGDRTSIKEDSKLEVGENFYTKILSSLKDYHPRLRMQSVNPSIVQSAGFINEIYSGRIEGMEIVIGTNCKRSLKDYQYALEDSDGTLKKTKKKHPTTGVTYEEYGHPSDAKRYLVTMAFANEYQAYQRGAKTNSVTTGRNVSKNRV